MEDRGWGTPAWRTGGGGHRHGGWRHASSSLPWSAWGCVNISVEEEEGARATDDGVGVANGDAEGGHGAPSAWRKWMARGSNDLEKFHPTPLGYILVAHHCRCQWQTDSDDVASLPVPKANQ